MTNPVPAIVQSVPLDLNRDGIPDSIQPKQYVDIGRVDADKDGRMDGAELGGTDAVFADEVLRSEEEAERLERENQCRNNFAKPSPC